METMKAFLLEKGVAKQYWPEYIEIVDRISNNCKWENPKV